MAGLPSLSHPSPSPAAWGRGYGRASNFSSPLGRSSRSAQSQPRIILAKWAPRSSQRSADTIWLAAASFTIDFGFSRVQFTPTEWRVASALVVAGRFISKRELMDHLYDDREDGGASGKTLDRHIAKVRNKVVGASVENCFGRGWAIELHSLRAPETLAA